MCMCFQYPYEGGEGVWVQDNPGAPERNGCMVAEVLGISQCQVAGTKIPLNGIYVESPPPAAIEAQLSGTLEA